MNTLQLSDAEFDSFKNFIFSEAGISITPSKKSLVLGRLGKRVSANKLVSFAEYYNFISGNQPESYSERQAAIDLLTTNETFFFREIRHFDYLRNETLQQDISKIRVWSAASSTGEEAYSIAMCLAAHSQVTWEVVGTDISSRVVEYASKGRYRVTDAAKIPENYLKTFCLKGIGSQNGFMKISSQLRKRVSFVHANLQKNQSSLGMFDLIMLRNVMIYFDKPTKEKVLSNVIKQLKPGGILMIGHAESLQGFVPDELTMVQTSIYQKKF